MNKPQLNSTGWHTIDFEPEISVIKNSRRPAEDRDGVKEENSLAAKGKKLIEWDDDELNDLHHLKDVSTMLSFQNLHGVITPKNDYYKKRPQAEQTVAPRKPSTRFSKLVYHGQVKRSGNMKVIDGIKLYINTHRPVSINRQVFGAAHHYQRSLTSAESPGKLNETTSTSTKSTLSDVAQEEPSALSSRWTESRPTKATKLDADNKLQSVQDSKTSWKPILFVSSRNRRTAVKQIAIKLHPSNDDASAKTERPILVKSGSDVKWKPITSEIRPAEIKLSKRSNSTASGKTEEGVVYGKKTPDLLAIRQAASFHIEQPFEDDGIIVANRSDQFEELTGRQREPKSVADLGFNKVWDNRWTPVETTTVSAGSASIEQLQTTTTPFPTPSAHPISGANHSESAQKSASDLNYIYSSQPVGSSQPQQEFNRQPSNSYYSNYVMQPVQQVAEQQPALTGTIIDTTSGQTPEMIIDREPQPVVAQQPIQSDYSMPQTSASFQPAQAPPSRPANMPTYADSYYNQPARAQAPYAAAPQPLPVRQSPTTVAPQREIVRQEHHYHYYNSNQQSERTQSNNNHNNNQQQPVREQSQIIRELQPLLITQPIIQQQASTTTTTTPAPPQQIIREIIKEVPMQTQPIQLPRIIIPQTMQQISMSSQPTRDLESVYPAYQQGGSPVPSAQRIIRQISSSIPTVSMRAFPGIAGIPQIKLPIPSIQLPLKLAAAPANQAQVTRQTGAFVIPPMPKKTTTYLTETQEMPSHTTIMHTTQFTPATRTIVYTTDHQTPQMMLK